MVKIKLKWLMSILFFINLLSIDVFAQSQAQEEKIIVGVYETSPYYEIDDQGSVSGYYHDLLMLLQENFPFEYEYVQYDFSEALSELKEGNIDLLLGVSLTPDRAKDILYSRNKVGMEFFALYSKNPEIDSVNKINGLNLGLVKASNSSKMMLNYIVSIGIEVDPVFVSSWLELENLFDEGKVDLSLHNISIDKEGYYKIYELTGDQVYIAASKGNEVLLNQLDEVISKLNNQKKNPLDELYHQYFKINKRESIVNKPLFWGSSLVVLTGFLIFYAIPKGKQMKIKNKIRFNMNQNRYLLQYQPIYNPRNRTVVAFEALLRLQDESNQLIPPYRFIPEIENNNMLFEISLWILKRVISEYEEIRTYDCVKNQDFYISINISLNELENPRFVKAAKEILAQSNLGPNKICLEIVERIKTKHLSKVSKNLMLLKQAGFKIAIDDFGTEYSNLHLLLNLDTDIIKIDKCFVEGIDENIVKKEIITFISQIAKLKNKTVILEGVEEELEARTIKEMPYNCLYVQGYYYNKPLFKHEIKSI